MDLGIKVMFDTKSVVLAILGQGLCTAGLVTKTVTQAWYNHYFGLGISLLTLVTITQLSKIDQPVEPIRSVDPFLMLTGLVCVNAVMQMLP